MAFDLDVARAVQQAKQIERALHDQGPWTIRVCGESHPAVRWILDDRVIFRVHLPDVCWLGDEQIRVVDLVCDGEIVGSRSVEFSDGESTLDWMFVLPETGRVRA